MANPAPKIVQPRDIAKEVQDLLEIYTPAWKEFDPDTGEPKGVSAALIEVFSRFAEIIIERLNKVPEKNALAFLDLLGASLLPPQPARVPLTFSLAGGSVVDGIVPAGTQVAAPPAEGEKAPVIFETERELVVTAAQLQSIFVRDPDQDKFSDFSTSTTSAAVPRFLLFQGNRRIEHILYLGHSQLLGFPKIKTLRLIFTLDKALGDNNNGMLEWQIWDGTRWNGETFQGVSNLTQPGENIVDFGSIAPIPISPVNSVPNRWLRCRLITPITRSTEELSGMVRESQLPEVSQVKMKVELRREIAPGLGLLPEMAFVNAVPVDLGKDFFPFGERPKFNDIFYLSSAEAFSKDRAKGLADSGAFIELDVQVANSHLLPSASSVWPSDNLQLAWECWNGVNWQNLGTSQSPEWVSLLELDSLPAFISDSEDEVPTVLVQGTAQKDVAVTIESIDAEFEKTVTIGIDKRFAVKVHLISGLNIISCTAQSHARTTSATRSRGRTTTAWAVIFQGTPEDQTVQLTVTGVPDEPVPPEQERIELEVTVSGPQAVNINSIRVTNGNALGSNSVEVPVVEWDEDQNPKPIALSIPLSKGRNELLIEGIEGIEGMDAETTTRAATTVMISREAPKTHDPNTSFGDYTYAFCQSGIVHLRLPDTTAQRVVNGQEAYWLRVRLVSGDYGKDASFTLKDPADPSLGFILVPASFRPPIVSEIKIGYQQTLSSLPEYALAYNNHGFDDVTIVNKAVDLSFKPFCPAPEEKPALYFGFTLPSGREAFPNRTVSMFTRMADFKFGERYRPVSPLYSRAKGTGGSVVTHPFFVTNDGDSPMTFELSTYGTRWITEVIPSKLDLEPGEPGAVQVQVTVPPGAPVSSQDKGYLRLIAKEDPVYEHSATFTTFVEPEPASDQQLELSWAYWNGKEWSDLRVRDDSENFTRSGLIDFLAPADLKSHTKFGLSRYWLRVRWEAGQYPFAPRLRRLLTNTTMAAQTITLLDESLGSSDGSENQRFRTTRAPVLAWQQLEVREPEQPSMEEQAIIEKEEGKDAISIKLGPTGRPREIWVRWHEVPDFYGSSARDRHYVLDHLTGEIRFGDGLHGRIPPAGTGNIRMRRYQTGGGKSGNKPAKSIVQLKTTVPYVDKVINTEPATGGANAEETGSLLERASHGLRHRERAVTVRDFEDLAKLASSDVACTLCVPLYNLALDPDAKDPQAGMVSLIIVPRSTDPKPLPSQGLIERVRNYLNNHRIPTAKLVIVGPEYIRVDIEAEIALVSLEGASEVRRRVLEALSSYLHPLSGGLAGQGWDFGRMPYKSDLYALIEPLSGVDHIRTLKVIAIRDRDGEVIKIEDCAGVEKTGRFLVYSGTHTINLIFPED